MYKEKNKKKTTKVKIKMKENITSKELIVEFDKVIQSYIDVARECNLKPTKDEIIEKLMVKLEDLLKINSDNKDRTWIISGIIAGIAISLMIDEKLKLIND